MDGIASSSAIHMKPKCIISYEDKCYVRFKLSWIRVLVVISDEARLTKISYFTQTYSSTVFTRGLGFFYS